MWCLKLLMFYRRLLTVNFICFLICLCMCFLPVFPVFQSKRSNLLAVKIACGCGVLVASAYNESSNPRKRNKKLLELNSTLPNLVVKNFICFAVRHTTLLNVSKIVMCRAAKHMRFCRTKELREMECNALNPSIGDSYGTCSHRSFSLRFSHCA